MSLTLKTYRCGTAAFQQRLGKLASRELAVLGAALAEQVLSRDEAVTIILRLQHAHKVLDESPELFQRQVSVLGARLEVANFPDPRPGGFHLRTVTLPTPRA